ncbi:hypothetical protein ACLKA7_005263 [Drosophila subpalustris]
MCNIKILTYAHIFPDAACRGCSCGVCVAAAAAVEESPAAVYASWCVEQRTGCWMMAKSWPVVMVVVRRQQNRQMEMELRPGVARGSRPQSAATAGAATCSSMRWWTMSWRRQGLLAPYWVPPQDVLVVQGAVKTAFSFAWTIGKKSPLLLRRRIPSPQYQPAAAKEHIGDWRRANKWPAKGYIIVVAVAVAVAVINRMRSCVQELDQDFVHDLPPPLEPPHAPACGNLVLAKDQPGAHKSQWNGHFVVEAGRGGYSCLPDEFCQCGCLIGVAVNTWQLEKTPFIFRI